MAAVATVVQDLVVDLELTGLKVLRLDLMADLQGRVELVVVTMHQQTVQVVATLRMEDAAVDAVALVAVGHVAVVDAVLAVDVVVADAVVVDVVVADAVLVGAEALDAAVGAAILATVVVEDVVEVDVAAAPAEAVKVDIHQTTVLVAIAISNRAMLSKTHQRQ